MSLLQSANACPLSPPCPLLAQHKHAYVMMLSFYRYIISPNLARGLRIRYEILRSMGMSALLMRCKCRRALA